MSKKKTTRRDLIVKSGRGPRTLADPDPHCSTIQQGSHIDSLPKQRVERVERVVRHGYYEVDQND